MGKLMAERPLLTIAVPTYNRHEELRNLHENFFLRLSDNVLSQLEVIVSDNSDAEIAYENARYFEGTVVKHFMNNGNVGYAKNIVNCVKKATGRFLWITSDDDHIYEDKFDVFAGWLAEREQELSSIFRPNGKSFTVCERTTPSLSMMNAPRKATPSADSTS